MQNGERVFYTSESGDRWLLLSTDGDIVSVRHVPNAASGGAGTTYELGEFLAAAAFRPARSSDQLSRRHKG